MRGLVGKALYGALFVLVLPLALARWARALEPSMPARSVHFPLLGAGLFAAGVALVLGGWWALRVHGGGLPMNAFPPPRYVARGVYRLFAHPVYVGSSAALVGVGLRVGSRATVWVVFPTMALAAAALVYGYERWDLVRRFGALTPPWLWIAPATDERPTWGDRSFFWACVLFPWCAIYQGLSLLGTPPDAVSTALPFERGWPVVQSAELVYASIYPAVLCAPLLVRTRAGLRALSGRALLSMAAVFPLYFALPFVAWPRPFTATTALGRLLSQERSLDTAGCAFPSFHVLWALLVAEALGGAWWAWALAVGASCLATGQHTAVDVLSAGAVFALVRRAPAVWESLRAWAERVANSWREWRFGPVRVIVHGAYAGAGTALGLLAVGLFAGPRAAALVCLCVLVGAALWAQWIEGASGLSRPYGFWGGLLGAALASLAAPFAGVDPWALLLGCAVGAPVVQSFGRLRCLVQGCCHGSPAPPQVGICYRHPRSRVTKVPAFVGAPLHPTPLYSIGWNVFVAEVVWRLASLHARMHLVVGAYLVLLGLGRFVEESYRGEPQTPVYARLRLYQWVSIAAAVAGAVMTSVGSGAPTPSPTWGLSVLGVALAGGALTAAAMGVDLPDSRKRFSRLA